MQFSFACSTGLPVCVTKLSLRNSFYGLLEEKKNVFSAMIKARTELL